MGIITIKFDGSFTTSRIARTFSAVEHGHAEAISRAIFYLAQELPEAIKLDHDLHAEGSHPNSGFGLKGKT